MHYAAPQATKLNSEHIRVAWHGVQGYLSRSLHSLIVKFSNRAPQRCSTAILYPAMPASRSGLALAGNLPTTCSTEAMSLSGAALEKILTKL